MIKLLIITPKYPPQSGGASYVFSLIAENIKNKVDSICVLTSTESGFIKIEGKSGIKVIRLFPYFESRFRKILFLPITLPLTLAFFLLHSKKFNVVESHTVGEICLFGQIFSKIFRKKLIKHVLDMQTGEATLKHPSPESFVCCGDVIQNKLKSIGIPGSKINNIHLPIKITNRRKIKKTKKKVFVFIGEISKTKGVLDILNVLDRLKGSFEMWFVGDGPELAAVLGKSKKDNRIKVHGRLDHDKVLQLLKKSDVLIHPTYSDVMPLSILEAMMLGNAIITTDIGEIKKTVGDGGIIIKPGDIQSLEKSIRFMLDEDIDNIKRNATERFREYSKGDVYIKNLQAIKDSLSS